MKKLVLLSVFLVASLFSLNGCKKEDSLAALTQYNVQTVPESLVRDMARKINNREFSASVNVTALSKTSEDSGSLSLPLRDIKNYFILRDSYDSVALYVYNYVGGGFSVISAELKHEPICAVVDSGEVVENAEVPSMLVEWFSKTIENIELVREGAYDNTERALAAWQQFAQETNLSNYPQLSRYIGPPPPSNPCGNWRYQVVGPLLATTWGQGCTYNNLCPSMGCSLGCNQQSAYTGCVATAMAQVVKYWNPNNSYNYNYASMPSASGNYEVQRLMKDIGRDVGMNYGCSASSASTSSVVPALKGSLFFGFYRPGYGFSSAQQTGYSQFNVFNNLGNRWPVILRGCANQSKHWFGWYYTQSNCHMWVCDGYKYSSNDCRSYTYFHMNWGWHESLLASDYNGWYAINNWNIPGRQLNFQYANEIIYNIHP